MPSIKAMTSEADRRYENAQERFAEAERDRDFDSARHSFHMAMYDARSAHKIAEAALVFHGWYRDSGKRKPRYWDELCTLSLFADLFAKKCEREIDKMDAEAKRVMA